MSVLFQINVTANSGSTGRIAEDIGKLVISKGWDSYIAFGRGEPNSISNIIRIGNDWDMRIHAVQTRLFDNHGLVSKSATRKLVKQIESISPDIIHLHNIHGYFLNYPILFDFLKRYKAPVVWTLHDCWPWTGHCAYYTYAGCEKWETGCHDCEQLSCYPASKLFDRSRKNFKDKLRAFTGLDNLTLVTVSDWIKGELCKSFLKDYPSVTIHNGIDLNVFSPKIRTLKKSEQKIVLGVANVWDRRKGLDEFIKLRDFLPEKYRIVLVGLTMKQISSLPNGIYGIKRTENAHQLAELYSKADVFANPTLEDNFPTTNLEALACGTPVVTYRTGGSPEAVDDRTGVVVPYRNIKALADAIESICSLNSLAPQDCRNRAVAYFDRAKVFEQYVDLYFSLLDKS